MNPNRARDHLANERTFLAWLRTGVAVIVFGFALGRFAVAIRELAGPLGHAVPSPGLSVWFGTVAIAGGVLLTLAGLLRYRQTRRQLDSEQFEPAGAVVDLIAALTALFGVLLAGSLLYVGLRL
jgi:putative membrane protein